LVQDSDGNFLGTTAYGGIIGCFDCGGGGGFGTIFKIAVSLNSPANQIAALQSLDTNVVLTIPSVAGETYQLQYRNSMSSGTWSNVVGACVTNSIGGALTITNFGGAFQLQGFYRFDITR
jgi:hypothetical protein